jgi:hypothetical protein
MAIKPAYAPAFHDLSEMGPGVSKATRNDSVPESASPPLEQAETAKAAKITVENRRNRVMLESFKLL